MGIPVLVGADPEVFLRRGNDPFPCVGLLPGTKKEPFAIPNNQWGITIQEDGVALELGFTPVPQNEIARTISRVADSAGTWVRSVLGADVRYYASNKATFTAEQLMLPQAQHLGCDPDQLAYADGAKRPPLSADDLGRDRYAGGHLHVGWNKAHSPVPEIAVIKAMDLAYLTYCICDGRDPQQGRRKHYGLAGLYRSKPYGVEYRTPSNFWFTRDSAAAEFITRFAKYAINRPQAYRSVYKTIEQEFGWELVQKSINEEHSYIPNDRLWNLLDLLERATDEIGEIDDSVLFQDPEYRHEEEIHYFPDEDIDEEEAA